jgi:G:T-mismatch repair DNA endonuclease (very short patch repair protein)
MRLIKTDSNHRLLPIDEFNYCLLDGVSKKQIIKLFPTREGGAYYLNKFENYLINYHNINLVSYIKLYISEYPRCLETKEEVGFKINGTGVLFSNFKLGKGTNKNINEKFKNFCERISKERKGSGNPMFGKKPWNKGDLDWAEKMRGRRLGKMATEETKSKQSQSAKKRKVHGHTGRKHSEKTKNQLRKMTAERYGNGIFKRETSIHIKMREFLSELNLISPFSEEHPLVYFSLDFAFPEFKIAIECQGTYFHIDPRFYPDGPKSSVQRRNFGRDKSKKKFLDKMGWTMIELWETEINNGEFKNILTCKLQELNLLNH